MIPRAQSLRDEQTYIAHELHRTRDLLSAILNNTHVLIACLDAEFNFLMVNRRYAEEAGFEPEQLLGKNHFTLYPDTENECIFQRVVLTGQPYVAEAKRFSDPNHPGAPIRYWNWSLMPLRDDEGRVNQIVLTLLDVTARRRAEMREDLLADTASRLLRAASPQAVVNELCQRVTAFLDCHAFFNFLVEETAGKMRLNACAGIPEEEARRIEWLDYGMAVCGCAARDACRIVAENIQNTPDPRTELVKSYGIQAYACHPLMVQGRVLGTLSFGTRNRTKFTEEELALMKAVADLVAIAMERERAQAELENLNEGLEKLVAERTESLQKATDQLNTFCHSIAHDLRAPLRTQLGFGRILLEQFGNVLGPEGSDYARRIMKSAERLNNLVQDLLAHSSVAHAEMVMEPVPLPQAVEQARTEVGGDPRQKETSIQVSVGEYNVIANSSSLHLIILNLLTNACKFTRLGVKPEVQIGAERRDGFVRLWVEDNGIGISPEDSGKLFGLFQRLHGSSAYPGTGMGLAIVKKAAERMGGRVGFESEAGVGSRFWVDLKPAEGWE